MDLNFTISPLSGYVGITKFSLSPTGTSANIPGSQYFWNFGDFNYSNSKDIDHVYLSPGIFNISLQITTPTRDIFSISNAISTKYLLQESISFEQVPPATLAGHYSVHPFRVRITSITPGEHWVDLYALYSRSTPEPKPIGKWDFIQPRWRFLDLSGNLISRIKTTDLPIYGPLGIIGYTGTTEFYFIDDSYNYDQWLGGLEYSTILATLETSATLSFDTNRDTQNAIPSFSNSIAKIQQPYVFFQRNPDTLKIAENGIRNLINPKWTNVTYPLTFSLAYSGNSLEGFIPYFPTGAFSHYHTTSSIKCITIPPSSVSFDLGLSALNNGFLKGTMIGETSSINLKISACASFPVTALSSNWLPNAAWISEPNNSSVSKIQILPTWLSATNHLQLTQFYTDLITPVSALSAYTSPNSFAICPYPDNGIWITSQTQQTIQKRNSIGQIISSIDLTSLINNPSASLGYISLGSNLNNQQNLNISLQGSIYVVYINITNNVISASSITDNIDDQFVIVYDSIVDKDGDFYTVGMTGPYAFLNQYNAGSISNITGLSATPQGIVIDNLDRTWITLVSGNSSYLQIAQDNVLLNSINIPHPSAHFITMDASQNPWFTCGSNLLGTYNITTSSTSFYTVSGLNGHFGGLNFLPPNNILVLDNDTSIIHVFNTSGTEIFNSYAGPPGFGFYVDDFNNTRTAYNSATPSLIANGDWTGWKWFNIHNSAIKIATTSSMVLSLTGISTVFDVLCANPYTIFKQNESYDMAGKIKELAILPSIQAPIFFDNYLGSIFGTSPLQSQDLGVALYEKVANWLNNTQNIDTCNIDSLYSLSQMMGLSSDDYRLEYPSNIKHWMDLASVAYAKIWGTQCQCQSLYKIYDSASNNICPLCGNYKPNNKGSVLTASAILSAGDSIILNTKSLNNFRIIPLGLYNNQVTYTLSDWVSTLALGTDWSVYYEFYQFQNITNNSMALSIVDWKNTQTNLLSANSSISAWSGTEQILDTIFSFELFKGLKLN